MPEEPDGDQQSRTGKLDMTRSGYACPNWSHRVGATLLGTSFAVVACIGLTNLATAQSATEGWQTGVDANTTTIVPRDPTTHVAKPAPGVAKGVNLIAYLTAEGQRIDKGLVWRVYKFDSPSSNGTLVTTLRAASPTLSLENGRYIVNVSFGRAHITREITVDNTKPGKVAKFILNAGGLRVNALLDTGSASGSTVKYDIYTDRDQIDNRQLVLAGVKPGLIIRLNAGIYHIVSKYGDANATVVSDITVEPGKLTDATVTHTAAKVRFKLVTRSGGEALPDTQWHVKTTTGDVVKKSVGALPTHILAPGSYTVVGISEGRSFEQEFTVNNGQMLDIEVLKQ